MMRTESDGSVRHLDVEVRVRLAKVDPASVGPAEEYYKIVHDQYTTQFLEGLGITPNQYHKKLVARGAPLEECEIETTWEEKYGPSGVASMLRIVQPVVGRRRPAAPVAGATEGASGYGLANLAHGWGAARERAMKCLPPDVPTGLALEKLVGKSGGSQNESQEAIRQERERVNMEMQVYGLAASEGADADLIRELERMRRRARRGMVEGESEGPVLVQWGEDGKRELELLKRKFILPFAAQRPLQSPEGVAILEPWQSKALQVDHEIHPPKEHQAEASEPIRATLEQIRAEHMRFIYERLPLELLTTRKDPWLFHLLRKHLSSAPAIQLVGLLAHTLYWSVFGHLHPPDRRLPALTSQSLGLTLQELWGQLVEPIKRTVGRRGELLARDSPSGICFVLPVFLLSLKRGVEHTFTSQYTKMFADADFGPVLSDKLVLQLNIMMMNIFDPDCAYANFGTLDSSQGAIRMWRKLHTLQMKMGLTPATRMRSAMYRTTPAVMLLMNSDGQEPIDARTRKYVELRTVSVSDACLRPR
eukprot:TRINITY_DN1449_c0_g2_i2.p1 TRINITY_DN1449_c0_g2~~TRINITY_DN1449_c0_g2_i2.p1  ORF type:complete len:533 (-),score=106.82 TRINITY_DN1449_c0_g2_i2:298-1896(-)